MALRCYPDSLDGRVCYRRSSFNNNNNNIKNYNNYYYYTFKFKLMVIIINCKCQDHGMLIKYKTKKLTL